MRPTVIFDFDGTIALGDGPLEAYAQGVADAAGIPAIAAAGLAALEAFAAGELEAIDGYDAVRRAAVALGAGPEAMQRGYLASREHLATAAAPIAPPAGLGAFLARLGASADLMLVTNSPDVRITESLQVLGATAITGRVCSARKPAGMPAIVAGALATGPVLSVGDVYENDLEPAAALGAATALVGGGWVEHRDRVTFAAATLPELYGAIEGWAAASGARAAAQ